MQDRLCEWMNGAKAGGVRICRWGRRHAVLLALVLLLSTFVAPKRVQGQLPSPCCALLAEGLGTINVTLGSVIAAGLGAINVILTNTNNFLQTTVWPPKAIAQALGMAFGGHTVVCKKLLVFVSMTLIAPRPAAITLPSVTLIVPRPSANNAQHGLGSCPCTLLGATRVLNNNTKASSTAWRRPHRHIRTPPAFAPFIHL